MGLRCQDKFLGENMSTMVINRVINREIISDKTAVAVIGIVFFVLATACGAFVRIPLANTPVPVTLQTFFVILSGAVLGKKNGLIAQSAYLVLGAAGLPFFTQSAALSGVTAGYLAGFVAAGYLTGYLIDKKISAFTAMLTGSVLILFCGMLNLSFFAGGMKNAFTLGVLPFIAGDMLKSFAAAGAFSIYKNFRR